MTRWHLSAMAAILCGATAAEAGCAALPEPCAIEGGSYHLRLPDGTNGPLPAMLLLHGYGGDGAGTIGNEGMVGQMLARGYAVIAPNGQLRDGGGGRSWDFHPDRPASRDETAFLIAVAADAADRFGLDRDRMLLAGFSIGGSMTSYVACAEPDAFAAYAPVAGSFWRPHPAACAGPVRLFHTHGTADRTVPLEGRAIRPDLVQGNVFEAMEIWRQANGCTGPAPEVTGDEAILRRWTGCRAGSDLAFLLHDGGHSIPQGWARRTIDWFEAPD